MGTENKDAGIPKNPTQQADGLRSIKTTGNIKLNMNLVKVMLTVFVLHF